MKCAFCGNTRFGLIHYQLITFNGVLRFCKKSCKDGHQMKVIEEVKRRKCVKFLFEETGRRRLSPSSKRVNGLLTCEIDTPCPYHAHMSWLTRNLVRKAVGALFQESRY
jgi:hypothetical protein